MAQVDTWAIDEKSIIISSLWYSYVVLAAAGALIGGGGIALIALRDGITGVDPSNLTVLIWTATGSLIVYFKSRRVENWPWRGFLHGRVVCRSLSEVQTVTKIDPQVLLAVLMRDETRMFLKKRGPFNTLFSRKSEDGFAIDVPPRTQTTIASGHIFIRVDGGHDPALVGLQAKTGKIIHPSRLKAFKRLVQATFVVIFSTQDSSRFAKRKKKEGGRGRRLN